MGSAAIDSRTKVQFLSNPAHYPDRPREIEVVESHMSWVFLTDHHAYKLKKPVRTAYLDFSTVEARRQDGEREVALNRRLAGDVYLGTIPLTVADPDGMALGGQGLPVDWLVKMQRLPHQRMLDQAIETGTVSEPETAQLAKHLAAFYRQAAPVGWPGPEYLASLREEIDHNHQALCLPAYHLPAARVTAVTEAQKGFLNTQAALLASRAQGGHIKELHGDLRPEHICLLDPPVIIDCLEFNRRLRLLDTADELAFLALECERLGAAWIGEVLLRIYRQTNSDESPPRLIHFYASHRALIRGKIAIWHLRDDHVDEPERWSRRALTYLDLAERHIAQAQQG